MPENISPTNGSCQRRSRRLQLALILPLLLASTACTTLPTPAAFRARPTTAGAQPELSVATDYALDTRDAMLKSLQDQTRNREILRGMAFVGTIATASSLAFGGSRDLTAAFGIATGSTLAFGALTTERGYDLTYDAAASALNCVGGSTRTALAANIEAHYNGAIIAAQIVILNGLNLVESADIDLRDAALARAGVAAPRVDEVDGAGRGLAARAIVSVDDIVAKARQQILTQIPNQAAFGAALSSIGTLGFGTATTIAGSVPKKPIAVPAGAALGVTPQAEKIKLAGAIASIDRAIAKIEASIAASTGGIKTQLEGCGFAGVAITTPLAVSGLANDTVEMAAKMNIRLNVSGGTLPYRADFTGPQPGDVIRSLDGLGEVRLITGEKVVAGTYTLEIRDSGNKVQSRTIKVVTK